jgi:hypothetical protein
MSKTIIVYGHPTCPNLGPVKGLLTQSKSSLNILIFTTTALPPFGFAPSIMAMKAYLHLSFRMAAL